MSNLTGPKSIPCPACKAAAGDDCVTVIDGIDTGWDHDARILAPVLAALAGDTPEGDTDA